MTKVLWGLQGQKTAFHHALQVGAAALLACWALSPAMLAQGASLEITLSEDAPLEIKGAKTVDSNGVIDLISTTPGLVVVDNRKQADFDGGRIEGATRILDTDMTEALLAGVVKSKATPVLFYCNGVKCGRAANATTKAVGWGYTNVYYYAEGIHDWKANQLPLVTQ